ncbi:hypothetical protein TIFTF001_002051 [Ficus carica]|uniref:Uncharacterized protein n=1 Tax=Ficus carica TaxID=3494 RepID=A0AA87Z278_FICCA|nr:hypothetical protein TIFTF001_002051 [Ficus carica]
MGMDEDERFSGLNLPFTRYTVNPNGFTVHLSLPCASVPSVLCPGREPLTAESRARRTCEPTTIQSRQKARSWAWSYDVTTELGRPARREGGSGSGAKEKLRWREEGTGAGV